MNDFREDRTYLYSTNGTRDEFTKHDIYLAASIWEGENLL